MKESRETEQAINENRNKYRTVAARGAMLFFLLNSLNKIHAFYQFSLNAFVTVFSRGLDLAPGGRKKKQLKKTPSLRDQVRTTAAPPDARRAASHPPGAQKGYRSCRRCLHTWHGCCHAPRRFPRGFPR